jgi:hypothetical protein
MFNIFFLISQKFHVCFVQVKFVDKETNKHVVLFNFERVNSRELWYCASKGLLLLTSFYSQFICLITTSAFSFFSVAQPKKTFLIGEYYIANNVRKF